MKLSKLPAQLAAFAICGSLATGATASVYSQALTTPGDFCGGVFDHTEASEAVGGVLLNRSLNSVPFLWVPCPEDSVVIKVDARSGKEMARYRMGPDKDGWAPCAVAVDTDSNAYVACESGGAARIVKINASGASKAVTANPEQTSFDVRATGRADALPWGKDTRVSVVTDVGGASEPSCLAFGANGMLWVGLWSENSVVAVNVNDGSVAKTIALPGRPSTMLSGSNGSLWVLCADAGSVVELNTQLGSIDQTFSVAQGLRSMALGDKDTIWFGSDDGLLRLNTLTGAIVSQRVVDGTGLRGVAADRFGNVWAACPVKNALIKFASADLNILGMVPVGRSPESVCTDVDGYVWSLNEESCSASRVDPRSGKLVATVETVKPPFSSTPFTACSWEHGVCPSGTWTMLFDSKIPGSAWGTIGWQQASCGGDVKVEVRSAASPDKLADQEFVEVSNGSQFEVPNGQFLEVRASLDGGGNSSPVLQALSIQGRNLPPDISKATPTTARIWKLDHSMEAVKITGVTDPEGDPVTIKITGVTQDEATAGLFTKDMSPDATGVGGEEVKLRAECNPGTMDNPGNGRVYTVSFKATDELGASTMGKVKVTVPAVLKWDAVAIEDRHQFDSTKDPEKVVIAKS